MNAAIRHPYPRVLRAARLEAAGDPPTGGTLQLAGRAVELAPRELAALEAADGSRSLEEIAAQLAERGFPSEPPELDALFASLAERGCLQDGRPKLTRDAKIVQLDDGPEPSFHMRLHDRYLQVGASEYLVLSKCDGTRTPGELVELLQADGVEVDERELRGLLGQFEELGYLDGHEPPPPPAPRRRVFYDGPFRIRLSVFDSDAAIERLYRRVRWLFSPVFFTVWCAVVLTGAALALPHLSLIVHDWARIVVNPVYGFLVLIALSLPFAALHELSHALMLKHYGGRVASMGIMLLYFSPAAYTDCSDAELLPRRARLWISAAGQMCDLLFFSVLMGLWWALPPGSPLGDASFFLALLLFYPLYANLNPGFPLDGMFFLQDLLRIPNLRTRSFAYLGNALARLLTLRRPTRERETSWRVRLILLLYGAVAVVLLAALLWVVIPHAIAFFTRIFGAYGGLVLGLVAILFFGAPVVRGARFFWTSLRSEP